MIKFTTMKKLILTISIATMFFFGCKKEVAKKECATITGEGMVVFDKTGASQRYFKLSNGKKVKTYINTKDAYKWGDEICYREDELFNQ